MFKFLRRYNKWILAVFGTLLLMVFLVPTTITELTRRSAVMGGTWGHLGSEKISEQDRLDAAGQMEVISAYQGLVRSNDFDRIRMAAGLEQKPEHWIMLVREATHAGLIGGAEEGRRWLQDQLAFGNAQITEAQLVARLAGASKQSPAQVLEALANMRGVLRMLSIAGSLPISDSRAKMAAAEAQMSASCEVAVLDGKSPLPGEQQPTPTDEEIKAQFEKYRDVAPGGGERGFGYRIPDRLKLEWIRVPAETVRASLANDPRLGSLELRKAYLKDPASFVPPTVAGGYPEFDAVEEPVKAAVLDRLTKERLLEIARFVEEQSGLGLRGLPRRGGYVELTDEARAKQPSFDAIVKGVSEQFGIPVPEFTAAGDAWMEPQGVSAITGLATAGTTRFGAPPRRPLELLRALREFGGSQTLIVQEGVVSPPLFAPTPATAANAQNSANAPSDLFFFRVVDAEANHPPESLDEVIEQVRTDLIRVVRYDELMKLQPQIEAEAIEKGIALVARQYGAEPTFAPRISEFSSPMIPGLGVSPKAAKAIIERAMKLPKTAPIADVPDAQRVFTVAVPEKLSLVLVRITNITPMTSEDFDMYASAGMLGRLIEPKVPGVKLTDLYGYDALVKRYDFKHARVDDASENQETATK